LALFPAAARWLLERLIIPALGVKPLGHIGHLTSQPTAGLLESSRRIASTNCVGICKRPVAPCRRNPFAPRSFFALLHRIDLPARKKNAAHCGLPLLWTICALGNALSPGKNHLGLLPTRQELRLRARYPPPSLVFMRKSRRRKQEQGESRGGITIRPGVRLTVVGRSLNGPSNGRSHPWLNGVDARSLHLVVCFTIHSSKREKRALSERSSAFTCP